MAREPLFGQTVNGGRLALLAAAASAPFACGAPPARADVPAVIVEPSAASRAELQRVVTEAANGAAVTLADDALTRESTLIVERRDPRDALGRPLSGRLLDAPQRFRLVLRDSTCVLIRESDARGWPLRDTRCVPAGSKD
jgi:hypothetical protein